MRMATMAAAVLLAATHGVSAQTYTTVLEPGSPAIAEILCARLTALGIADARVIGLDGGRIAVETRTSDSADLPARTLNTVLTRPGQIGLHLVLDTAKDGVDPTPYLDPSQPPLALDPTPLMTSADLESARMAEQFGQPALLLSMTADGAERLATVTEAHLGDQLAIVVDGVILSAPRVQSPILGGQAQITGVGSDDDLLALVAILTGGALPEPLAMVEAQLGGSDPATPAICTSG